MDASLAPYHQQHLELLRWAATCEARLDPAEVRQHPERCLAAVRRLVGLAKAHLAMENTILYPALLGDRNVNIQAAARALEADLGQLQSRLRDYGHHWKSPETVGQAPEAFTRNSRELFRILRHRIKVEASALFPLVEQA
jgi:iron-sulfur cluster repair protein YtfE (RIC family)